MIKLPDFNNLMQQEMSRQEFLRFFGLAFLSLIGLTAFLQNIEQVTTKQNNKEVVGYGASAYGR